MSFSVGILTDEFAQAAAAAGLCARREALASGHAVIFVDDSGRMVQETPDGRLFEVRLNPGAPPRIPRHHLAGNQIYRRATHTK